MLADTADEWHEQGRKYYDALLLRRPNAHIPYRFVIATFVLKQHFISICTQSRRQLIQYRRGAKLIVSIPLIKYDLLKWMKECSETHLEFFAFFDPQLRSHYVAGFRASK